MSPISNCNMPAEASFSNNRLAHETVAAIGAIESLFDKPSEILALVVITTRDGRAIHGAIVPAKYQDDALSIPNKQNFPRRIYSVAEELGLIETTDDENQLYRLVYYDPRGDTVMRQSRLNMLQNSPAYQHCQGFITRSKLNQRIKKAEALPTWVSFYDIFSSTDPDSGEPTLFDISDKRFKNKKVLESGLVVTSYVQKVPKDGTITIILSDGSKMKIAFTGNGSLRNGLCENFVIPFLESFRKNMINDTVSSV